ncbi:MAG: hypothetical protein CTR54_17775 [Rhizobium sp.]|jgi:hypothetical protein|nr:MAG: hypothetical protein CTR54_17775 [Rhizobium sp.]
MEAGLERAPLLVLSLLLVVSGVLLRPFWLSEWGPYTFTFLVWLTLSLVSAWHGRGNPRSIGLGLFGSSIVAFGLLVTIHTNAYVGMGVFIGLVWLGSKIRFFTRRE